VLQDCLELLSCFRNNALFPFLLYASRIFPDKKMKFTVQKEVVTGNILVVLWQNFLSYVDNHV
jgi:hypothetical protein